MGNGQLNSRCIQMGPKTGPRCPLGFPHTPTHASDLSHVTFENSSGEACGAPETNYSVQLSRVCLHRYACGSKKWYQHGTLVNGTKDKNPRNPNSLILSHTHMATMGFNREPPHKWLVDRNPHLHDVHQRVPNYNSRPSMEPNGQLRDVYTQPHGFVMSDLTNKPVEFDAGDE